MSLSEELKPLYHKGFTTRFEVDETHPTPWIMMFVCFPDGNLMFKAQVAAGIRGLRETRADYVRETARYEIDTRVNEARRIVETADASVIPDLFNF